MVWQMKKWSEVVDIISGKNQKAVANPEGKYPIYGSGGIMGYADDYLCEAGTTIVGRKGTINNPIFVNSRFWNVDTAFGINPKAELMPKYLYYFCRYFNFKELDKSTTIPSLAKRDLLAIEMPVPSIFEQERIIARIEELFSQLDNGVETLQKTKQQLAVYRQAVLKSAFDGYCKWPKYTFNDLLSEMRNGYGQKPDDEGEHRLLRISSVRAMNVDLNDYRLNKAAFDDKDIIRPYDLLFTRYNGSVDYVGVCAYVRPHEGIYAYPDKIIKCRLKEPSELLAKYIQYYMCQGEARQFIRSRIKTTSGQNGIAGSDIKKVLVYIPDSKRIEKIVNEIEERMSACDSIEVTVQMALQKAEAMRQSILKQAFEGRLNR